MTAEEVFCKLIEKYGEDFNWRMIPFSDKHFVEELKKEIGNDDTLFKNAVWAVARSYSNDDVLYLVGSKDGIDVYRIYHLTYSSTNTNRFPRYQEFVGIENVRDYIEKQYMEEQG